jgi:hypothetical protein
MLKAEIAEMRERIEVLEREVARLTEFVTSAGAVLSAASAPVSPQGEVTSTSRARAMHPSPDAVHSGTVVSFPTGAPSDPR